ncbi:MAG TPA: MFS transporter [Myxococcota bacterium]|nr:MFS transporter [Myxococcota bacterium]
MQDRYAPSAPPAPPATTFAALGVRNFRVLWSGTWASYVPFFMSNIVNGVVAFQLAHRNRAFGAVIFAQGLAMALLAPLGGAGADRWPKRRVLALSQGGAAAVFASFAILHAFDSLTILGLALGTFVLGVSVSFLGPARQALAAELVEPELRGNAVTLNQIPLTGSQLLGPAVAGAMLRSPLGAVGAYALMSSLYAIAAITLFWLPKSMVRANAGETHVLHDLGVGLRYVWAHRRLRLLVTFFVIVIMTGFSYITMLPGLVEHAFARSAQLYVPPLSFASAAGGLLVTFVTARIAGGPRVIPMFLTMPFVFAAGLLSLSFAPSYELGVAAMVLVGVGFGGFQTLNAAVIVQNTEPAYFGRVFSLSMLAFAGVSLVGLPVGFLADAIGERTTLLVLSTIVIAVAGFAGTRLRR